MKKFVGKVGACVAVAVALLFPSSAHATTLTLDNTAATPSYQQTTNSPCIFGGSCQDPATSWPGEVSTINAIYPLTSNTFTVKQITDIVGNSFFVGIDVNSTTKPFATEQLAYFDMVVNGTILFQYSPASATTLFLGAQGNGYSDALLKEFSLAGQAANTEVIFHVNLLNATDGFEQFFLIASDAPIPPPPVPEPASMTLLGLGLAGVARIVRRARV